MTRQQIDLEKERAEDLAKTVGGALPAILGLRSAEQPITWDGKRGRFVIDGRFVSMETIRRELRRFETSVGAKMRKLADRFARGSVQLPEWREEMNRLIGSSHVVMGAVAAGSIAAAAANRTVQERVAIERQYAAGFAEDIEKKKLKTPTITARAQSYLLSAAVTHSVVGLAVHKLTGYKEASRITTAAESCPDCQTFAYQWMPIDKMPGIGSLACGSRCRCYLDYR